MIEVSKALALVLTQALPNQPQCERVANALGMALAEDIVSDIDSPPHDKSLVDGYAVRSEDITQTGIELRILEDVLAGDVPSQEITSGTATRIMTGAPIPAGADAVIMVEETGTSFEQDDPKVRINSTKVSQGQNIMRRAASLARDERVLRRGQMLRPIEIGLLSEVGRTDVFVVPPSTVAVLATGNELVEVSRVPDAGQIRNSNGPMICALVEKAGARAVDLGIARDTEDELNRLIAQGLEHDVLVLSGGVSAGVMDLVPSVLSKLGVEQVFHRVNLKPGKPLWFGVLRDPQRIKLVFGLPGNPVSSLVCFELFVRAALLALSGRVLDDFLPESARLACEHSQRGARPTYWPSRLEGEGRNRLVEPLDWQGSADLRSLVEANCLAFFPGGDKLYGVGCEVRIHPLQ